MNNRDAESRKDEVIFPFSWESWDQMDTATVQFYDVLFTDDFGKFKKGEKYREMQFDYSEGTMSAQYDEDGMPHIVVYFRCCPR